LLNKRYGKENFTIPELYATKCPICGKEVKNPKHSSHIRSIGHQIALKIQEVHKELPTEPLTPGQPMQQVANTLEFINLKSRIKRLETQFENLKGILIILVDELDKEGVLTEIIVSRFLKEPPRNFP